MPGVKSPIVTALRQIRLIMLIIWISLNKLVRGICLNRLFSAPVQWTEEELTPHQPQQLIMGRTQLR